MPSQAFLLPTGYGEKRRPVTYDQPQAVLLVAPGSVFRATWAGRSAPSTILKSLRTAVAGLMQGIEIAMPQG